MATKVKELVATFGLQTDKQSFSKGQQAVDKIKSAAKTFIGVFAAGAVAKGFGSMVERASDAAEALNVIGAAFGENQQDVLDWAQTTSEAMGRSEFKLREMAGSLGALVQPMVKSRKTAAEMSKTMAGLAVDIGSFFNATDEEALVALRAGLVGSTEPLLRFGVNLQVAQLEAFALSKGIKKSFKEMSIAEKTQLRFQSIMEQTANAQGDAAKTAEGYANASKALKAAITDVTTRIGQAFLPSAERSIRSLRNIVKVVNEWLKANDEIIKQRIDRFMMAIEQVMRNLEMFFMRGVNAVRDWTAGLTEMQKQMLAITGIALGLAAVLLLPGGALLFLIGLVALLIDDFETWREGGKSVIGDLIGSMSDLEMMFPGLFTFVRILGAVFDSVFTAIQDIFFSFILFVNDLFEFGFVRAIKNLLTNLAETGFGDFIESIGESIAFAVKHWAKVIWDGITGVFNSLSDYVVDLPILGKVIGGAAAAAGTLAGGGSALDALKALASGGIAGEVSPRPGSGGISNQQTSNVSVAVQAAPGMNEAMLAQQVAEKVDAKIEEQNRTAADALAVGVAGSF